MQVEGRVVEPGSRVVTEDQNARLARQQFYQDEDSGTIRSVLRKYCLDLDDSEL